MGEGRRGVVDKVEGANDRQVKRRIPRRKQIRKKRLCCDFFLCSTVFFFLFWIPLLKSSNESDYRLNHTCSLYD